jgi:translocation and assembly module TamB
MSEDGPAPTDPSADAPAAPAATPAASRGRRRWPLWLGGLGAVFVLAPVVAVGLLLATETGLKAAFDLGARLAPGTLSVRALTGRLLGPFEVTGLAYEDAALGLRIERVALDWRPSALLSGRVHVLRLEVEGVRVAPGEPPAVEQPEPAEPPTLPDIVLPVEVRLDAVRVADARLEREGVPPLEELRLRASAQGQRVEVGDLAVRLPGLAFDTEGVVGLGPQAPADLRLHWRWQPPGGEPLVGEGRITGPIPALRIEHLLSGAAEARLDAAVEGLPAAPRWDARVTLTRVEPARVVADVPPLALSGTLQSRGTPGDLRAEGSLTVELPDLGAHRVDLSAALTGGTSLRVERLELARVGGEGRVSAVAEATLAEVPEFRAEARWQALAWPLEGEADVASPEGRLSVEGSPQAFRFRATSRVIPRDGPATDVEVEGTGSQTAARIERLVLALLEGRISAEGDVGWAPEPRWDLRVTLDGLNPGARWPDWAGRLGGTLTSRGRVSEGKPALTAEVPGIEGVLRGYPVRLAAGVEVEGSEVRLERLALASGKARVTAQGSVGEVLALEWSVDAPDLAQVLPGAAGTLRGSGRVTGTPASPRVAARLDGSALAFQDNGVSSLAADVDLGLARQDPFRLTLAARGLSAAGKPAGDLVLSGSGSQPDHRVTLDLTGGELGVTAAIALAGGLDEAAAWTGRLERADFGAGEWGDWRLQAPAGLTLGPELGAKALCWASGEARVCAGGERGADGGWSADLAVTALPLALFKRFLPEDIAVSGAAEARVTAAGTATGDLKADARLALPGAALEVPLGDERQTLDLSRSSLRARVDGKGAAGDADLRLGELASLGGRLELPGWSPKVPDTAKQRLSGRVEARVPDLAWVRAFARDLGAVEGRVDADLTVAGTLGAPRLTGRAALEQGRVEVPAAGLDVQALRLEVRSQGADRLVYEGGARSGEGELAVSGSTVLDGKKGWPTRVEVKGADFTVIDTPEYWALVSPDLALRTDPGGAALEGEILIPRARIKPRALPKGTVTASRDVVVKGAEEVQPGTGLPVSANVRVRFGDPVLFEGFSLRGKFAGEILVTQRPGKEPLGNGKVGIVDGVYSGLSRDLTVERGWVVYASSPLDDPGLDVEAVTRTADITAGVRVTGPASDPTIEFFSNPARPQSDVIAYILFGRPLGTGASESDRKQVQDAAAAVGGALLASEIGRQLGLDELRVEDAGDQGPALSVGQYVSPRLYLQYLTGLRSSVNRLRIRYDLTPRIQLQTETGDEQSADIFYTIDR